MHVLKLTLFTGIHDALKLSGLALDIKWLFAIMKHMY